MQDNVQLVYKNYKVKDGLPVGKYSSKIAIARIHKPLWEKLLARQPPQGGAAGVYEATFGKDAPHWQDVVVKDAVMDSEQKQKQKQQQKQQKQQKQLGLSPLPLPQQQQQQQQQQPQLLQQLKPYDAALHEAQVFDWLQSTEPSTHRNVVKMYAMIPTTCTVQLVLELGGGTLEAAAQQWRDQRQAATRPLQMCNAEMHFLDVSTAVVSALEHVHSKAVVHGDLHACNVLVSADGAVIKICDFGNACCSVLSPGRPSIISESYKRPGTSRQGFRVLQPADDIWALGVTMGYVLSGTRSTVEQQILDSMAAVKCSKGAISFVQACLQLAQQPMQQDVYQQLRSCISQWQELLDAARESRAGSVHVLLRSGGW